MQLASLPPPVQAIFPYVAGSLCRTKAQTQLEAPILARVAPNHPVSALRLLRPAALPAPTSPPEVFPVRRTTRSPRSRACRRKSPPLPSPRNLPPRESLLVHCTASSEFTSNPAPPREK